MKKLFIALAIISIIVVLLGGLVWAVFSGGTFHVPGKYYITIEQDVRSDSFFDNTYKVDTVVWLRDWKGWSRNIIYMTRDEGVKCDNIPKIKSLQMAEAKPHYIKALKRLETFRECKYEKD